MQESKQYTMIYPMVQLTTKACLLHVVEVGHKWLGLAFPSFSNQESELLKWGVIC
jgi:hypothetical protein